MRQDYVLRFKWTESRGRDTYGYNICTLYVNGTKVTSCNGGGYDMVGTCLGDWLTKEFADRIRRIPKAKYPEHRVFIRAENPKRICTGSRSHPVIPRGLHEREEKVPCPTCGAPTQPYWQDGELSEPEYLFYGLSFHHYDKTGEWVSSAKQPDRKHRVPYLDGACGSESMWKVAEAIGLKSRYLEQNSYLVTDTKCKAKRNS
jgi:hypothetical protein